MKRNLRAFKSFLSNYIRNDFDNPFYASFKVTHRCNLRCDFCNVWNNKISDLKTEQVYKIIDNLSRSSIFTISFEGGEPLLRKDMGKILKHAHDLSNYILFTTNGLLIDKSPFEEYAKYFDFLELSIDEGHQNVHLFDRLSYFKDLGIKTTIQTVVTRCDLDKIDEKVEKASKFDHKILIMPAFAFQGTEDLTLDLFKLREILLRLKEEYGNVLTTIRAYIDSFDKPYACRTLSIMVEPNGDIMYPCMEIGTKLGNLLESDLYELMWSSEAKEARQKMLMSLKNLIPYAGNMVWFRFFG